MTDENTLAISVLTPVYNQERYIAETIDSVLSQNYPNLEYLVLDDGSTDNTLNMIKNYSQRIQWQTHANIGETATVNKGVKMLNNEIVGIVNGDDPLLPGALAAIANFFTVNSNVVAVYPDWKMIDAEGKLLEYRKTEEFDYISMLRDHDCLPGPGTFFRRDLFLKVGGRDTNFRYVADFDFWLRAALLGPFARIPQTLACHRWYADGTSSSSRGSAMAAEHIKLVDKIYSLPNLPKEYFKFKNIAYSSAHFTAGICCGEDHRLQKEYFHKAIQMAPFQYFGRYRRRYLEMLNIQFPIPFQLLVNAYKKIR